MWWWNEQSSLRYTFRHLTWLLGAYREGEKNGKENIEHEKMEKSRERVRRKGGEARWVGNENGEELRVIAKRRKQWGTRKNGLEGLERGKKYCEERRKN